MCLFLFLFVVCLWFFFFLLPHNNKTIYRQQYIFYSTHMYCKLYITEYIFIPILQYGRISHSLISKESSLTIIPVKEYGSPIISDTTLIRYWRMRPYEKSCLIRGSVVSSGILLKIGYYNMPRSMEFWVRCSLQHIISTRAC